MKKNRGRIIPISVTAWLVILVSLAIWSEIDSREHEYQQALAVADTFFQQLMVSNEWNTSHKGVYVPITPQTQPNQYLSTQDRDLTADNGLKLTKINPAQMIRQLSELASKKSRRIQFHMTSLKPIKPENKATPWEETWLRSFSQGSKAQGKFIREGDTIWFRYMAPLPFGPKCLECHTQQRDNEGNGQGGISISIPYSPHTHIHLIASYSAVAVIGLLFIFIGGTLYERKRRLFDATFNSPVPTCVTDKNHIILIGNESYWSTFGVWPDETKAIKCYEHRKGKYCQTSKCPLTQVLNGAPQYICETRKEHGEKTQHFIVTAKPLFNSQNKVVGIVESFQDITDRKRDEEALKVLNQKLAGLSNTDGLTGIANRRHFDIMLAQEYARHARSGATLSLILLDIDYFKAFNDCYGHVKGDECLQQIASVMADSASRPADLVARYGGEEFIYILPETDNNGANALAEKIRQDIIALAIPHKDSNIADHVTASFGVITVRCNAEGSVKDIINQVDEQLYEAKFSGRNQIKSKDLYRIETKTNDNLVQLVWHNTYCSGNQLIDSQHQNLFNTCNEVLKATLLDQPSATISTVVSQLLNDIRKHFHDEEEILESIGFPGLTQHKEEHTELLRKTDEMTKKFTESTLKISDLCRFLANEVVMQHMLGADQEFFPFIGKADTTVSSTSFP